MNELKTCVRCGHTKPRKLFYSNGPGRWKPYCYDCGSKGVIRLISDEERNKVLDRFDAGESITRISIATGRSRRAVTSILKAAGRHTGKYIAPPKDPSLNAPIGSLPPGHPLYESDQEMVRAIKNPRGAGANPWARQSSLADLAG